MTTANEQLRDSWVQDALERYQGPLLRYVLGPDAQTSIIGIVARLTRHRSCW